MPISERWRRNGWTVVTLLIILARIALTVLAVPQSNPTVPTNGTIHISGLLPLKTYPCYALAALHAVNDVNTGQILSLPLTQSRILPDQLVRITFNDTTQDSSITVAAALWQMETYHTLALLGEITSGVTAATGILASAFKTPLIAPQATVNDFSNKLVYPYVARDVGGDDQQAYALHSMMLYFGWTEAQILYAVDSYGTAFAANLQAVAAAATEAAAKNGTSTTGVKFNAVNSFATGDAGSIASALKAMQLDNSPIVVLLASRSADARTIASQIVQGGLLGKYQFVGCDGFFHTSTIKGTSAALRANYTAFLSGMVGTLPLIPTGSGPKELNLRIQANTLAVDDSILAQAAPTCALTDTTTSYIYDAVLIICIAASQIVAQGRALSGSTLMTEILSGLNFPGLTGQVQLNSNGDRFASYSLTNYYNDGGAFSNVREIGVWAQQGSIGSLTQTQPGTNPYTIKFNEPPVFFDGSHTPPSATYPRPIHTVSTDSIQAGLIAGSVVIGCVIGILPLLLAIYHRSHVVMKASSVLLTGFFLCGVTLGCVFPSLAGLPISPWEPYSIQTVCLVPYLLLAIAFDIMFSCLLTKTSMILDIFNNTALRILKFSYTKQFKIMGGLILVDGIIFILWSQLDSPTIQLAVYPSDESSDYFTCRSSSPLLWQLLVMLPKFLMMLILSLIAYRVKDVPHAFNESRFLALILYNLIFVSSLTILLINTLQEPLASLIIASLGCWFCLGSSSVLLMVPKLLLILGSDRDGAIKWTGGEMAPSPQRQQSPGAAGGGKGAAYAPGDVGPGGTAAMLLGPGGAGGGKSEQDILHAPGGGAGGGVGYGGVTAEFAFGAGAVGGGGGPGTSNGSALYSGAGLADGDAHVQQMSVLSAIHELQCGGSTTTTGGEGEKSHEATGSGGSAEDHTGHHKEHGPSIATSTANAVTNTHSTALDATSPHSASPEAQLLLPRTHELHPPGTIITPHTPARGESNLQVAPAPISLPAAALGPSGSWSGDRSLQQSSVGPSNSSEYSRDNAASLKAVVFHTDSGSHQGK